MNKIDELIQELCTNGVACKTLGDICLKTENIKWKENKDICLQYIDLSSVNIENSLITGTQTITSINAPSRAQQIVKMDDVIFGTTRPTLNRLALITRALNNQVCSTGFCVLRANPEILLPGFLLHILGTTIFHNYVEINQEGASYPSISDRLVRQFQIPIPPIPVQEEIVRILDAFTMLEAELEAELEARKQQYDFYRNKLLTPIEIDGKWYMNGIEVELKALVDLIISLKTGLNPRKNFILNPPDAKNFYITVRELNGFDIVLCDKTDKVDDNALALISNRSKLSKGDVLFSGTGTIGKTALVSEDPEDWNIKEGVYAIKPDKNMIMSKFLIFSLNSSNVMKQIINKVVGSPVCSIPMAELKRVHILVPTIVEQERIVSILNRFDALVNDISIGLPAEITARRKQYEYYRNKLLTFKNIADKHGA